MANESKLSPLEIPADLKAHALWTPTDGPARQRAVYVTERSRRKAGIIVMFILLPTMTALMFWGPAGIAVLGGRRGRPRRIAPCEVPGLRPGRLLSNRG